MPDYTLTAKRRSVFGKKLKKERKGGQIPAILYGHGVDNIPLFLDERSFSRTLIEAGRNTIIKLELLDESGKTKDRRNVLIHDVSLDPIAAKPIHADLYQIRMDEKVRVEVPLVFNGESPAVEVSGGILVRAMQALEVEALPGDLPPEISVDISGLQSFGDTIYVKNLKLPPGVSVLVDKETPIVSVAAPRTEEELKALEAEEAPKVEEVKVEGEEGAPKPEEETPTEEEK